jgi:hypothetical protein
MRLLLETCHHMPMTSLKVFAASLLLMSATLLSAQHSGAGAGAGFGGHASGGRGPMVSSGNRTVIRSGFGHRGNNNRGYGAGYFPWYVGYGDYWNDGFDNYAPDGPPPETPYQAAPSVIVMQSPQPAPAPRPGESPKVIDVPLSASDGPAKPQSPALFVLQNGQRIESTSYVVSNKSVTVDVGQQRRVIPLSEIDLNETVAVNRQRGLELAIPRDSSSLFLSF